MNHYLAIAASTGLVAALLAFAHPAVAITIPVNDATQDLVDDNPGDGVCHTTAGTCTLRAAFMEANHASGAGATISIPAGIYRLTRSATIMGCVGDDETCGDLNLTAGDPVITITGSGAATTIIDANQIDRVLNIDSGRSVSISGVTIRNGYSPPDGYGGGGLVNNGALTLDNIILTGNDGDNVGGAIANHGTLVVRDSSLVSNFARNSAGGLLNSPSATATVTVTGSTIAFNAAAYGGGLLNSGTLFIVNSTVAANEASVDGGGIYQLSGAANIYNSTIAYNDANSDADSTGYGGGVYISSGVTLNLRNSLVVGNHVRGDPQFHSDCYGDGTLVPYGRNLTTTIGVCNVATGNSWALLNSLGLLGPLQNNGGQTQTMALLTGSNAIDTAGACTDQNGNTIPTDQRGYARTVGSACDIGAYEYNDVIFTNGFEP